MSDPNPGKPGAPPALPIGVNDDAILSLVRTRAQHASNKFSGLFKKCSRWYDLYRGTHRGNFQQFRNNLSIPFVFSVIQSDVARKVQTSFGSYPIVEFTGYSHADSGVARKNEALISAQMKDSGSFVKAVDFFTAADMYGTGIARVGWKQERELIQQRIRGGPGEPERILKVNANVYDGPDWDPIDIMDALIQPGKKLEVADWFIHRFYMDLDTLREQARLGIYDEAKVRKVEQSPMSKDSDREYEERRTVYRTHGDYDMRRDEKYAKPVEIKEMWGRVPAEMATDGYVDRVITVANGTVVIRNRPNPFWHGKLPFLSYSPMADPHFFHGIGKIEICEKMQFAANRFANQKMDGLDLAIDNMWLVDRTRGIDTSQLFSRSGKVIGIDGPVDDSVIRPLSPDMRGLELVYQEIGTLWQWIQQGTGIIEDTVQGAPSSGRQTAREFQGRQENVLTRLMLETRLAEEGFVEPLANMYVALNKQFLQVPTAIRILGSDAQVNPITGYPYPQEPQDIDLADLNHDYRARAVGATQMLGRSVRQQNLMALLQVMGANQVGAQMVNWAGFFKEVFEAFDMRNFDELINQQPTQANQTAAQGAPDPMNEALGQASQGGQPGQNGGGLGASPGHGDLPPDITSSVLQELEGQMPTIQNTRGY